ncbi:SLC13 family permease [Hydrogenimonas sp.]
MTMLPLVLSMRTSRRMDLAILVALTAHVGAALTPFGTPQNLFIYRWYGVELGEFLRVMTPFVGGLLLFLLLASLFVRTEPVKRSGGVIRIDARATALYLLLFALVAAAVVGLLPAGAAIFAIVYALLFDRSALQVDYGLLLTFLLFIGLTGNIREIIDGMLAHRTHTFLLAAVMSQFISNVPTTLMLERFTDHWRALLWGVNVGGFGSLVAAMANLIAYKLFLTHGGRKEAGRFVLKFIVAGYVTLLAGTALHYLFFDYIHRYGG